MGDVTILNIGNNTTIREHVSISPGTLQGGGVRWQQCYNSE
jgi:acyl-[acyl carrier protein]--UDP-N-acetylglucosamine O-acyltransferase